MLTDASPTLLYTPFYGIVQSTLWEGTKSILCSGVDSVPVVSTYSVRNTLLLGVH